MEQKQKILLVDDSDLITNMISSFLHQAGYEVITANNGIDGIIKAYTEIPDLIVMDVDMPILKGYQASRLLKNRRGVKDIPIIMQTSHSEDKDMFWAINSGVNAFVLKDFDNLDTLLSKIKTLIHHKKYEFDIIKEDAKLVNKDFIFQLISEIFDTQLFRSTILNELAELSHNIGSLKNISQNILTLLTKVCDAQIGVLCLRYNKENLVFARPSDNIFKDDVTDFIEICITDYYEYFPSTNIKNIKTTMFNLTNRNDFNNVRSDNKKISSYICLKLLGSNDNVIGTLHIGNFINNYFSSYVSTNIEVFAKSVGIILENSILFSKTTEMEYKIKTVFAKFVPKEIIDDLVERESQTELLTGEKRNVAILFSDIRSFTTISEYNSPDIIVDFLNKYFDTMGHIIKKYGGTIDKFIGDAILAIFGAPISYEDNAQRAVDAAKEMVQAVKNFQYENIVLPKIGFKTGIGIHEGEVIVGNIGSSDKFDYTVIGDNVNLASRLEGLTKHYHQHILLSDTVNDKVKTNILSIEIDTVKVKGKDKPTTIYGIITEPQDKFNDSTIKANYEKALSMYKMQNWMTAKEYFNKVLKDYPDENLSKMYIKRINDYIKNPPDKNWDGSVALDFK